MNYNKLTSLVANVEAIETAVQIHVQGRTATTDEKEILSLYSGFGGIKEVLNIGTDNPVADNMTESLNRLETALRTLAGEDGTMYRTLIESIKASVLTAFTHRSSLWTQWHGRYTPHSRTTTCKCAPFLNRVRE